MQEKEKCMHVFMKNVFKLKTTIVCLHYIRRSIHLYYLFSSVFSSVSVLLRLQSNYVEERNGGSRGE